MQSELNVGYCIAHLILFLTISNDDAVVVVLEKHRMLTFFLVNDYIND